MINTGTYSIYDAYKDRKKVNTSSNAATLYFKSNETQKDVFVPVTDTTIRLSNKPFIKFIAELMNTNDSKSIKMILDGYVSVNGTITSDSLFILSIGDIVRCGIGHYLRGTQMAVVN